MKEIGGYLELEQFYGREYYPDLIAVNNGRCALLYILKAKKIKKLYIPFYLCESVTEMCKKEGYTVEHYNVKEDFTPSFEKKLANDEALYIVNYFGQIDNKKIKLFKSQYERIIVDNVQAFFQKPVEGVDTVYSCRKFFGVPDGGYVSTDALLNEEIPQDVSMNRMKHILGRLEGNSASNYYADFKESEASYKDMGLMKMSKLTKNLLRAIDYDRVLGAREQNFRYLDMHLKEFNKLPLIMPVGPYAYPFYYKDGMKIKKELARLKVFIPTLWPNVLEMNCTKEKDYAENILPLPVDQRYSTDDMKRIVEEILKCLN